MLPPKLPKLIHFPFASGTRSVCTLLRQLKIPCTFVKAENISSQIESHLLPDVEAIPPSSYPIFIVKSTIVAGEHAVLRFIASKYVPELPWYPPTLDSRIRVDMVLEWSHVTLRRLSSAVLRLTTDFDADTCTAPTIAVSSAEAPEMSLVAATMKDFVAALTHLDTVILAGGPFLAGEYPSIADLSVANELALCQIFDTDLSVYPRLFEWYERYRSSMVLFAVIEEDYGRFRDMVADRQEKKKAHQEKIRKHGKDAAGGNRAPDVKHTVLFPLAVQDTFKRFTSSPQLKEWTKSTCHMLPQPGGTVSLYDQRILGSILYIEKNCRLLVSWKQMEWGEQAPPSTVRMHFTAVDEGTRVVMEQADVPAGMIKKTDLFWSQMFWKPSGGVLIRDHVQQLFFENVSPHDIYEHLTDSAK